MVEYRCDATRPLLKKVYLDLQKENGRAVSVTKSYYLNTRDIPIRQHFQVRRGTWKEFQVKRLSQSCLFWDSYHHIQISQRNASCAYKKH